MQQLVDELALERRGDFEVPEKVLAILFASRSGSNYLGQLLSSTGWFREIGESFRPSQLSKIRDRYGLRDRRDAAQWMIDNRGTAHAFGFKAGFTVLVAAAELGFLTEVFERTQFVLLRRRDQVAQAVSLVKSKLSGRTHSGQPEARPLTDSDYDAGAIAFELSNIVEVDGQLAEFLERLGKPAPVLYYEDICAEPTRHVEQVCRLMGLEMPADFVPKVRLGILRDEISAGWTKRFRAENPQA